jgi:hypothetical protein
VRSATRFRILELPWSRAAGTHNRGTPLACLTLLGAFVLSSLAWLFRVIDCSEESYSTCSTSGRVQLLMALAGLVPALGMMIQSGRGRGRPALWLLATALVYATWGLYLWLGPEFGAD